MSCISAVLCPSQPCRWSWWSTTASGTRLGLIHCAILGLCPQYNISFCPSKKNKTKACHFLIYHIGLPPKIVDCNFQILFWIHRRCGLACSHIHLIASLIWFLKQFQRLFFQYKNFPLFNEISFPVTSLLVAVEVPMSQWSQMPYRRVRASRKGTPLNTSPAIGFHLAMWRGKVVNSEILEGCFLGKHPHLWSGVSTAETAVRQNSDLPLTSGQTAEHFRCSL